MINTIKEFIKDENLIEKNDTIVVGLSGGVDSMVLFDCLYKMGYKLVVAHVHHNKRIESDKELEFVKDYVTKLNVPFESIKLDKIKNTNFEAEARRLRYEFFFNVAKKYNAKKIATAHHLDDLLETVLMHISRGSNLYGYGGIKPIIKYDDASIIRPLLCVSRKEILEYQKLNSIPYMEDNSNSSNDYTRNRYRHNIIPLLVSENENIYKNIMRYSKQMYMAFDHIRDNSINLYKANNGDVINSEFIKLDDALKMDYLSYILEQKNISFSFNKLTEIKDMIISDKPNSSIKLSNEYSFIKDYDKSYLWKNVEFQDYEYICNIGDTITLPNGDIVKIRKNLQNNEEIYLKLCYNTLVLPFKIRNRRDGDYFDFKFGRKKIKDLFIDMKIPTYTRKTVPFIFDNNDNLLGIPGILKGPKDVVDPVYIIYEVKKK